MMLMIAKVVGFALMSGSAPSADCCGACGCCACCASGCCGVACACCIGGCCCD